MDFNGNGALDVLSGSWPGELYLFRRESDGSFAAGAKLEDRDGDPINTGNASTVFAVDWDEDGDLDLITGNISGEVHFVPNEGTRTEPAYGKPVKLSLGTALQGRSGDSGPIVADWDGDGLPDLLVGMGDGSVVWFRNTGRRGEPEFGKGEQLVPQSPFGFKLNEARPDEGQWGARVKIHAVDFNGNGRLDLLLGDRSGAPPEERTPTDEEREAAREARTRQAELVREIARASAEVRRLERSADGESDAAELTKARTEHQSLVAEYTRLQGTIARVEPRPVRHGFVWLFERRLPEEVARR